MYTTYGSIRRRQAATAQVLRRRDGGGTPSCPMRGPTPASSSPTAPTAARRRASSRFRRAAATFRPSGKGSGVSLASTSSATPKRRRVERRIVRRRPRRELIVGEGRVGAVRVRVAVEVDAPERPAPRPTKDAGKAAKGTSSVSRQPVDVFAIAARSPGADGEGLRAAAVQIADDARVAGDTSHVVALPFELLETPAQRTLAGPAVNLVVPNRVVGGPLDGRREELEGGRALEDGVVAARPRRDDVRVVALVDDSEARRRVANCDLCLR